MRVTVIGIGKPRSGNYKGNDFAFVPIYCLNLDASRCSRGVEAVVLKCSDGSIVERLEVDRNYIVDLSRWNKILSADCIDGNRSDDMGGNVDE